MGTSLVPQAAATSPAAEPSQYRLCRQRFNRTMLTRLQGEPIEVPRKLSGRRATFLALVASAGRAKHGIAARDPDSFRLGRVIAIGEERPRFTARLRRPAQLAERDGPFERRLLTQRAMGIRPGILL